MRDVLFVLYIIFVAAVSGILTGLNLFEWGWQEGWREVVVIVAGFAVMGVQLCLGVQLDHYRFRRSLGLTA
ncbi:hypothetical protein HY635_03500 [Candidatus Uhrbacteria bacterium]|nr:hypothetical protein [Candidatus Uhrbacteria bacterium]